MRLSILMLLVAGVCWTCKRGGPPLTRSRSKRNKSYVQVFKNGLETQNFELLQHSLEDISMLDKSTVRAALGQVISLGRARLLERLLNYRPFRAYLNHNLLQRVVIDCEPDVLYVILNCKLDKNEPPPLTRFRKNVLEYFPVISETSSLLLLPNIKFDLEELFANNIPPTVLLNALRLVIEDKSEVLSTFIFIIHLYPENLEQMIDSEFNTALLKIIDFLCKDHIKETVDYINGLQCDKKVLLWLALTHLALILGKPQILPLVSKIEKDISISEVSLKAVITEAIANNCTEQAITLLDDHVTPILLAGQFKKTIQDAVSHANLRRLHSIITHVSPEMGIPSSMKAFINLAKHAHAGRWLMIILFMESFKNKVMLADAAWSLIFDTDSHDNFLCFIEDVHELIDN